MEFTRNFDLVALNSFGVHARASLFATCSSIEDVYALRTCEELKNLPLVLLGGGSNVLFADQVEAVVVKVDIKGREVVYEDEDCVIVRFGAGEVWHDCVTWAVEQNYGGIENMALIPGTIGASPIQNIGAYGREFKDVAHSIEFVPRDQDEIVRLLAAECEFAYRDSIFKHELRDKVTIVAVELRLTKKHQLYLAYKDLQDDFASQHIVEPTIKDVYESIVRIRTRKLPQPSVLGNAGSFFKNAIVDVAKAQEILALYPHAPIHEAGAMRKIPTAWLIEQCGMKGMRRGDAGVYEKHALVLVNHGNANGSEIIAVAKEVREAVKQRFGILLDIEVNIVGASLMKPHE